MSSVTFRGIVVSCEDVLRALAEFDEERIGTGTLVVDLYELTEEEIAIVEGRT